MSEYTIGKRHEGTAWDGVAHMPTLRFSVAEDDVVLVDVEVRTRHEGEAVAVELTVIPNAGRR